MKPCAWYAPWRHRWVPMKTRFKHVHIGQRKFCCYRCDKHAVEPLLGRRVNLPLD